MSFALLLSPPGPLFAAADLKSAFAQLAFSDRDFERLRVLTACCESPGSRGRSSPTDSCA